MNKDVQILALVLFCIMVLMIEECHGTGDDSKYPK